MCVEDRTRRVGATESPTGSVGVGAPSAGGDLGLQVRAGGFGREIRRCRAGERWGWSEGESSGLGGATPRLSAAPHLAGSLVPGFCTVGGLCTENEFH